ncbi:MAG: nucleotide excision repair endonuclease [Myxococcota bacterium]
MAAPLFDRKFGADFLDTVPTTPGVYEMLDAEGHLVYVGKAKSLRDRLAQYRRATRRKAHAKMRAILGAASSVRLRPCASELDALLLENELIQTVRPPLNVAGAYTFLYPCVGVREVGDDFELCRTTSPGELPMYRFYGAWRDRRVVSEGFEALCELFDFVAHREPKHRVKDVPAVKFTRVVRFRRLEAKWRRLLDGFLRGDSRALGQQLLLALLERPAARRHADDTQAALERLGAWFELEARPLREALCAVGQERDTGVSQAGRDPLFLRANAARSG